MFTNAEALCSPGIVVEVSSHRRDWSLPWSPALLPSPRLVGVGLKSPSFSSWLGYSGDRPIFRSHLGPHLELPRDSKRCSSHPGNSKGFSSPVLGIEDDEQLSISFFCNVYLFLRERERERERESEHKWGRVRERGRHRMQSRLQAPSCQHRAWCGAWTHELQDHDLSPSDA